MMPGLKIYGIKLIVISSINPEEFLPCGGKKGKKNSLDRGLSHRFGMFFLIFFYSFAGF